MVYHVQAPEEVRLGQKDTNMVLYCFEWRLDVILRLMPSLVGKLVPHENGSRMDSNVKKFMQIKKFAFEL